MFAMESANMTTGPLDQENPRYRNAFRQMNVCISNSIVIFIIILNICFFIVTTKLFKVCYFIFKVHFAMPFYYYDLAWLFLYDIKPIDYVTQNNNQDDYEQED
jgi:hypothetical protein